MVLPSEHIEAAKLQRLIKSLDEHRERVIKLHGFGEIGDEHVEKEMKQLNRPTADAQGDDYGAQFSGGYGPRV